MPESTVVKTKRDGTITISDGAGTPSTYTVAYENGDFNLAVPGPTVNVFQSRGQLGATPSCRYGDDQPMTGSFTVNQRDVTDGSVATIYDIATQNGAAGSGWVSTLGADAEVFTVNLTLTIEGTEHGDAADHTIQCPHCVLTSSFAEGDPSTYSLSFTSYAVFPTVS